MRFNIVLYQKRILIKFKYFDAINLNGSIKVQNKHEVKSFESVLQRKVLVEKKNVKKRHCNHLLKTF